MPLRQETIDQMKNLSMLRGGRLMSETRELTRTDDVLDEILQMLSLCFLSLGKLKESKNMCTFFEYLERFLTYFRPVCIFSSCYDKGKPSKKESEKERKRDL